MIAPGIRVARGPDWIWNNQDDGEGHIGTVCELGRSGSTFSPEKTVIVNWDSGNRSNYRVGYQEQYDLIIVDNAQIGVRHANIECDGCSKSGLAGIRFRCAQCANFDLCAACYGDDVHDLNHEFIRYQSSNSAGVRVPPRNGSVKIEMKGIFVGAKVVQGHDWEWGQQDGGKGKSGLVMEIRGWDNISCRSVANVTWLSGSTNVYRLGHKGNVDLKYIQAASGGYYYRDHMPILGKKEEQQPIVAATRSTFTVGDRVKVCLDRTALMKLQQGHGGWNPRMAEYLNKVGCVHRITDKGDIRVQYEACSNRWTFHPAALVKVCTFQVGDLVTIITDAAKVEKLQKGHGEWVETMRNALGKSGKITKVYTDGDLRVQQIDDGFAWTLNPKCVKLERSPAMTAVAAERSNSMMDLSHQRTDHVMTPLSDLSGTSAVDKLVREAAQGRLEYVKQYLDAHPDQVDCMSAGKTCLQVAAHQGHVPIIKYLLTVRANVNIVDKEGDSTLHYAAFGNQPEIMKILLGHGAHINVVNSSHCSALHISAHKRPPHCVKVLLEFGANVNIQDSYGDTALHDAIGKENAEVVELLCNAPNLDLTVRNNRGFNALHHASLKGNVAATRKILQLAPQLVDIKKNDGFAPLHLASLNGHSDVAEILVREGKADINIRNNRRQTPFLLAVAQGHTSAIEKLVDLGCDVLVKDEDGDNALHLCVIKKSNLTQEVNATDAPKIYSIYQSLAHCPENRLMYAILCYLAQSGCQIDTNNKGNQILHWVLDKEMQDLILSYVVKTKPQEAVNGRTRGGTNELRTELDQIYTNIQSLSLTESGNSGSANTSFVEMDRDDAAGLSIPSTSNQSNPPTPMRRQQHRDQSNASPLTASGDELSNNQNIPKKMTNIDQDANKRLVIRGNTPTASSSNDGLATASSAEINNLHANVADNDASNSNAAVASSSSTSKDNIKHNSCNPMASGTNDSHQPVNVKNESQQCNKIINQVHCTQPNECIVCNEVLTLVIFEPCSHQIACGECSIRMKKCLSCGRPIDQRRTHNGKEFSKINPGVNRMQATISQRPPASDDRLRYLESKIMEIEETHCCGICMERGRNVAFLCGHSCCSKCAETLKTCHMCRKTIIKKINLY